MQEVLDVLSKHRIQLESSFATIVLAMAMLEGLGRSLDPHLDLLRQAAPVLVSLK
jgi:aarF domain-containing kinase